MPGVVISTVATGQAGVPEVDSGQMFLVGSTERGPKEEVVTVRGLADYETVFGNRFAGSNAYDIVDTFFRSGGRQAHVVRANAGGETASATINNRQEDMPGTSLELEASSSGTWGNDVRVVVTSSGDAVTVEVFHGYNRVESITTTSMQTLVNRLNRNVLLNVASYDSASQSNIALPADGEYQMTGGTLAPFNIGTGDLKSLLDLFVPGMGDGVVIVAEVGAIAATKTIVEHCEAHRRIAYVSVDGGLDVTDAVDMIDNVEKSRYLGLFAPDITIQSSGVTRTTSALGAVAGRRAFAHNQIGAHRIPAGEYGRLDYVVDASHNYTAGDVNSLDDNRISAIRKVNGTYRVYGYRSMSDDEVNWKYLTNQDLINRIAFELETQLEQFVFAPIDGKGQLQSSIEGVAKGILSSHADAGALYPKYNDAGEQVDPGFIVDAGPGVNSIENLANNTVRLNVQLRTAPTSAMIEVTIVKLGLNQ